jgi:hypothetical protein
MRLFHYNSASVPTGSNAAHDVPVIPPLRGANSHGQILTWRNTEGRIAPKKPQNFFLDVFR